MEQTIATHSTETDKPTCIRETDDLDSYFARREAEQPELKALHDESAEERALGIELARARISANMSQRDLTSKTGISQSAICNIELGCGNPSLKTLKRLAAGLGLKVKITFEKSADMP